MLSWPKLEITSMTKTKPRAKVKSEYEFVYDTLPVWSSFVERVLWKFRSSWPRFILKLRHYRELQRTWYHCNKQLEKISKKFRKQLTASKFHTGTADTGYKK